MHIPITTDMFHTSEPAKCLRQYSLFTKTQASQTVIFHAACAFIQFWRTGHLENRLTEVTTDLNELSASSVSWAVF